MDNTEDAEIKSEIGQIQNYQEISTMKHQLLNNILKEKIEQNKKEIKTWTEFKNRHKKVIEGLQEFPLSVSENCMVPISRLAFMKGKLIHTNEVLACLGDGYFVKYSASQAIALCNRRISFAEDILKRLEDERNLYETRQILLTEELFDEQDKKDVFEHWDEDKLDEWRIQHRQREKEYRQKLVKLKEKEETRESIRTEEDLFKRLDELELEEELEDEMNRLEEERRRFYGDDLEEGEVYDESEKDEDSSDFEQIIVDMLQEQPEKYKYIQADKVTNDISDVSSSSDTTQNETLNININRSIYTGEDLFKRLDKLELEEGLEDKTNSLEEERRRFYGDDLEKGKVCDESEKEDDSFDSEQIKIYMLQEQPEKYKYIQANKVTNDTSDVPSSSDTTQDETLNINSAENEQSNHIVNFIQEEPKENSSTESGDISETANVEQKKRVSFVEPCDQDNVDDESSIFEVLSSVEQDNSYSDENDDVDKIEFSHSSHTPNISESSNTEIQSPADIYKIFSTPIKPILKRSPNDMLPNQIVPPLQEDSSTDTDNECYSIKPSAYSSVSTNDDINVIYYANK
ncbi:Unconventional prefoldin RPB5 interactor [Harpegnathos saltator]|uniref:Unconventional prefoldin RPB5 interactor n=1 Tax=Harpegnathos saltator TaxID=610380 RepID=E2C2K7_HARSA|nr:Unconventional prefoldin RPB5 interactor [Harpegnathos saltator]